MRTQEGSVGEDTGGSRDVGTQEGSRDGGHRRVVGMETAIKTSHEKENTGG